MMLYGGLHRGVLQGFLRGNWEFRLHCMQGPDTTISNPCNASRHLGCSPRV